MTALPMAGDRRLQIACRRLAEAQAAEYPTPAERFAAWAPWEKAIEMAIEEIGAAARLAAERRADALLQQFADERRRSALLAAADQAEART